MKKEIAALLKDQAEAIKHRDRVLDENQNTLEGELNKIKEEREQFKDKLFRATTYNLDSETCPICFIEHGLSAAFKPVPSDTEFDKFKCTHCGYLLEVEV